MGIGGPCNGAPTTPGAVCLMIYRSVDDGHPGHSRGLRNQHRYLQLHIFLIPTINIFLQVWDMYLFIKAILVISPDHLTFFYRNLSKLFIGLVAVLTDGLTSPFPGLTHTLSPIRSAAVAGLHNVRRIIPLTNHFARYPDSCQLRFLESRLTHYCPASGRAAITISNPMQLILKHHSHKPVFGELLFAIGLICNTTLNIFGTLNIAIRLFLHRRSAVLVFGQSCARVKGPKSICVTLLESAALNIAVALRGITLLLLGKEFFMIAMSVSLFSLQLNNVYILLNSLPPHAFFTCIQITTIISLSYHCRAPLIVSFLRKLMVDWTREAK